MSIELNGPPCPAKAPACAEGGHAKGKSNSAGESGATQAGDFLSLLLALGAESAAPELAAVTQVQTSELATATQTDMLLAQSAPLLTAAMAPADVVPAAAPEASLMLSLRAFAGEGSAAQDPSILAEPAALPVSDAAKALQLGSKTASRREAMEEAVQAAAAENQVADEAQASDPRFLKSLRVESLAQAAPALPAVQEALASAAESGLKPMERQAEKFGVKPVGGGADGGWWHQAMSAGARVDSAAATIGTAMPSTETMVAEQVRYWVSSGVQKAELSLDGLGHSPVEVSISLQGIEARVEFRTDQAEVRQVLEGATAHLKELLGSEGVVLSGVSVGSSGSQGGAGSQEPRPRPHNVKQATIVVSEPVSANVGLGSNALAGRSIDLFV